MASFKKFFRESGIEHYLGNCKNKKRALEQGFTELIRRHERLPFKIIREAVVGAIDYRIHKRNHIIMM